MKTIYAIRKIKLSVVWMLTLILCMCFSPAAKGQNTPDTTNMIGKFNPDDILVNEEVDSIALLQSHYDAENSRYEDNLEAFLNKGNQITNPNAIIELVSDISVDLIDTTGNSGASIVRYYGGYLTISNCCPAPNPISFTVSNTSQMALDFDFVQSTQSEYFIMEIKNSSTGASVYFKTTKAASFALCMTINNYCYYKCTDVVTLPSGSYTVYLRHSADKGNGNSSYYYYGNLSFEIDYFPGETLANPIMVGTFNNTFSYSDSQYNNGNFTNTYNGPNNQPSSDIFYSFTLTQKMEVTMTHCGSTISDSYMHLLNSSGNLIESNNDYSGLGACSNTKHSYIKRDLAAGTYYVVSEGYGTNTGMINTNISGSISTGDNMSNPVNVGTFSNSFQYANIKNTNDFTNVYVGRSTNDVYYKFTLTQKTLVKVTHLGSVLNDTYMYLLNGSGALLESARSPSVIQRELAAGTYYVVSEGYSQNGYIQTNITGYGIELESPDFFANPFLGDTTGGPTSSSSGIVGSTEGELNVTPSGAAIYEIPIKVPPGTGGMTPNLSIVYNSQGGDGVIGKGFSLSGLSEIARVPGFSFLDGTSNQSTLTFDGNDRFVLDGQELMCISSTYGYTNAEYRTVSNEFSKIITVGGVNFLPQSFTVRTKSGLVYEYGGTSDSRVTLDNGKVVRWLVSKITDTKGNYMTITYLVDASTKEYYPSQIDYTGNGSVSPALAPYCSVRFIYSSRSATNLSYVSGTEMKVTKKLDNIKAYYGSTIVKTYQLNYNQDYTLQSIQETGKDGTKYNPIVFDWYVFNNYDFSTSAGFYVGGNFPANSNFLTGDFNGDGKSEVITYPQNGTTYLQWKMYQYSSSNESFSSIGGGALQDNVKQLYAGDFNGDGKMDFLEYRTDQIKVGGTTYTNHIYYIYFSTGSGFVKNSTAVFTTTRPHEIRVGDVDGNGMTDVIVFYKDDPSPGTIDHSVYRFAMLGNELTKYQTNGTAGVKWDRIETGDFDGDGLMDVMNLNATGYSLYFSNGGGLNNPIYGGYPNKDHHIAFGDFNGDGKTDMVISNYGSSNFSWWMYHGNGKRNSSGADVFVTAQIGQIIQGSDYEFFVCDINGDGRDDIVAVLKTGSSSSKYKILLANETGTYFTVKTGFSVYPTNMWQFYTGDFNGDGRADVMGHSYWVYKTPSDPHHLLKKITNGMGFEQEIEYKKMTDNTVYQPMGTYEYPLSDFMAPINLVYETKSSDGIGGWATTRYNYKGAKVHKKGKGMLGFTEFSITDVLTNTITTSTFEFESNRYATALKKTETKVSGKLVSKTDYVNKLKTYNNTSTYKTIYTYQPVKITDETYEYSSSLTTPYQTTVTRYQYDDYGNIDRTSIRYSTTDSVVNVNVYDNTAPTINKWHLGRLTKATVTKYSGGQTAVSVSDFIYDPTSGLLTKETVQPADTLGYTKTYKHDGYGNIKQSTTKGINYGNDNTHRTQYTTFDNKGRFVETTKNSLGHQETQVIDPYLGAMISKTSPNGLITQYKFDGFGQTFGGISPDGNQSATFMLWNKGHADAPPNTAYYVYSKSSGSPPATVFYDKLGRELRQVATGFDGTLIYVDTEYNAQGQVSRVSDPYFKDGTPLWTVHTYDATGRITQYTLPDNTTIKTAYNGFTTTVTNQLNQVEMKTVDAQGRLTVSKDNINGTVTYTYNANGNVKKVVGPRTTINMEYDNMGNLIDLKDPDLGNIKYRYNIFGETVYRKHLGKNLPATTFAYDSLGRMTQQVEPEGITTWVYDKPNNDPNKKLGMLSTVTHSVTGAGQEYFYDNLCRIIKVKENIAANEYYETLTTYDQYGRTDKLTYPNNALTVQHVYNAQGYLQKVKNFSTGVVYWTAQQMNARGQLEQFLLGNNLQTTRTYQATTGHLQTIKTTKAGGGYLQDWSYTFDAIGNLKQRKDITRNKWEDFEYDNLNRLTQVKRNNVLNLTMAYDAAGNMTKKTDLGDIEFKYTTGTNRLDCINFITTGSNDYNPGDQHINYTSFDKVSTIGLTTGAAYDSLQITYGTAHQRIRATTYNASGMTLQRTYVGALYEKEYTAATGETKNIYHIFAGGGAVAIYTVSSTTGAETVYLHKDHLGSIVAISSSAGALKQELSYDAWGNRRDPATWALANVTPLFARGFTGHEHLDLFALVNMNGRMYDPVLGRFLSPDPYMQAPDFTQGLNRYIYCLNNPLSLTDPSGYSWLSHNWKMLVASAVGITISALTAGTGAPFWMLVAAGASGGAAGSMTGALLNGANFGQIMKAGAVGGFWGAVSSAASFGVGSLKFGDLAGKIVGKSLAHGISQGAITAAQGGKFQHGFFSAALSSGAGHGIMKINSNACKVLASSVVGGTASVIGGGKFANGAVTGAYVMLFNHMRHGISSKGAKMMRDLNRQFQYGRRQDVNIDVGDLDFSMTSRAELGLPADPIVGKKYPVNLFDTGVNELSLSFGRVEMVYEGSDQFSIVREKFDFEFRFDGSITRNAVTLASGFLLYGRISNIPILYFNQPNHFFGGPFWINFKGSVIIK